MSDHAADLIDVDTDIGSLDDFASAFTSDFSSTSISTSTFTTDDGRGRPRHYRARHRASRHRADDTGSLRIVRHRRSAGAPGDEGSEMVGYALLITGVGLAALTVAQLSSIAVSGLDSVISALQVYIGG